MDLEEYQTFYRKHWRDSRFRSNILAGDGTEVGVSDSSYHHVDFLYDSLNIKKPPRSLSDIKEIHRNYFMGIDKFLGVLSMIDIEKRPPCFARELLQLLAQEPERYKKFVLAIYLSNRDKLPRIK